MKLRYWICFCGIVVTMPTEPLCAQSTGFASGIRFQGANFRPQNFTSFSFRGQSFRPQNLQPIQFGAIQFQGFGARQVRRESDDGVSPAARSSATPRQPSDSGEIVDSRWTDPLGRPGLRTAESPSSAPSRSNARWRSLADTASSTRTAISAQTPHSSRITEITARAPNRPTVAASTAAPAASIRQRILAERGARTRNGRIAAEIPARSARRTVVADNRRTLVR